MEGENHEEGCLFLSEDEIDCDKGCGATPCKCQRDVHSCFEYLVAKVAEKVDANRVLRERVETLESLEGELKMTRKCLQTAVSDEGRVVMQLQDEGLIDSRNVYGAMMSVDLNLFHEEGDKSLFTHYAKILKPVAPYVLAGSKVLVLLSEFSAILHVYLALMAGPRGSVVGKLSPDHVDVVKDHYTHLLDSKRLKINVFNKFTSIEKGYPTGGPYSVIFVPSIGWANSLKAQLKPGGVVVNPFEVHSMVVKTLAGTLRDL